MHIHPNELSNLQRPKLLMSTAKCLVEKRKFKGHSVKKTDPKRIQALLETEARLENDRKDNNSVYHPHQHIEVLADLIEYAYLLTYKMDVH